METVDEQGMTEEDATQENVHPRATMTRRRPSERIINKKLAKKVMTKNGEGSTSKKPVNLE